MLSQPADMVPGLPNCGIVAAATFLNVPYRLIWDLYRIRYKMGPRWRGVTLASNYPDLLEACGVPIFRYEARREYGQKVNVRNFAKKYARPGVTYMLFVGGHFLTVRDGWASDQHACAPIDVHPAARKLVRSFFVRKGQHGAAPRTFENSAMRYAAK
jgi:hypothetical protein